MVFPDGRTPECWSQPPVCKHYGVGPARDVRSRSGNRSRRATDQRRSLLDGGVTHRLAYHEQSLARRRCTGLSP